MRPAARRGAGSYMARNWFVALWPSQQTIQSRTAARDDHFPALVHDRSWCTRRLESYWPGLRFEVAGCYCWHRPLLIAGLVIFELEAAEWPGRYYTLRALVIWVPKKPHFYLSLAIYSTH